ncbi:MAG: hypothetical protein QXJ02_05745 [Candidatus Bathyarchaeia archaeon]
METSGQEPRQEMPYEENNQIITQEDLATQEETTNEEEKQDTNRKNVNNTDRSGFIHGISVGLGMGSITTFVIIWIAIFFTPQLPSTITYESLLSIFIYPLIYLLTVGLVALTAGIVREYFVYRRDV